MIKVWPRKKVHILTNDLVREQEVQEDKTGMWRQMCHGRWRRMTSQTNNSVWRDWLTDRRSQERKTGHAHSWLNASLQNITHTKSLLNGKLTQANCCSPCVTLFSWRQRAVQKTKVAQQLNKTMLKLCKIKQDGSCVAHVNKGHSGERKKKTVSRLNNVRGNTTYGDTISLQITETVHGVHFH